MNVRIYWVPNALARTQRPRLAHRCSSTDEAREWVKTAPAGTYRIKTHKESWIVESDRPHGSGSV